MDKFRLLTRNLMLGKKYFIIDDNEEVKSEIAEKESEDLFDDQFSDEEISSDDYPRKKSHLKQKKECKWDSSDEDDMEIPSESENSVSLLSDRYIFHTSSAASMKKINPENCSSEKVKSFGQFPRGILRKKEEKIFSENSIIPEQGREAARPVKKVIFNLSKNTVNGRFLFNFKSTSNTP